jgi:hypothetical protein
MQPWNQPMTTVLFSLLLAAFMPDSTVTPGVIRPLTLQQVCSTRWGLDRRFVTTAMKKQVFANYGIPWDEHRDYEVDHLVPRELGGADDIRNLWPQSWTGDWNAHQKDVLENRLRKMVCFGQLSLEEAQEAIRVDWRNAYLRYVN